MLYLECQRGQFHVTDISEHYVFSSTAFHDLIRASERAKNVYVDKMKKMLYMKVQNLNKNCH